MVRDVVPMTAEHVAAGGALVAARHAGARAEFPLLPAAPTDADVAAELLGRTLSFCRGVVALDDGGDVIGFLTGFDSSPDPTSPAARYSPERAALHLVHGHAVAASVDPFPVYAALLATLAADDLEAGILDQRVHVPIGAAEAAWVALGFGRTSAVAVRDLRPTGRPAPAAVAVRAATIDDLDAVDLLVDEEAVFHAAGPMFRPYLRDQTVAAVRAELAAEIASDDRVFLLARCDGADVGVLSIGPGLGSPLYIPDDATYIAATAVLADARGAGVGAALVDAACDWARDHGHAAAWLHYATANATSTAFWTGIGFEPVMVHMHRSLDHRIRDARPGR